MKTFYFLIFVSIGIALLACSFLHDRISTKQEIAVIVTGQTQKHADGGVPEVLYESKIKNTLSTPIRLCGGQMNWCGRSGCYKVITPFPVVIKPRQEAVVTVSISPRREEFSETELVIYADGKGLNGLTPVKIKLPVVSSKLP